MRWWLLGDGRTRDSHVVHQPLESGARKLESSVNTSPAGPSSGFHKGTESDPRVLKRRGRESYPTGKTYIQVLNSGAIEARGYRVLWALVLNDVRVGWWGCDGVSDQRLNVYSKRFLLMLIT